MLDIKEVKQLKVKAGVSPEERQMLYNTIIKYKPEYVVETGSGATTASFLAALEKNNTGQLISIDKPDFTDSRRAPGIGDQIRALWKELKQHYPNWIIHEENIIEKLPLVVEELPQIDFFYHDSLHMSDHVLFELDTVLPKLRVGGIFGTHDVTGKWREQMKDAVKKIDDNDDFECIIEYRASKLWQRKR